nr:unnamed protein product [Callosobruchus chinensis]
MKKNKPVGPNLMAIVVLCGALAVSEQSEFELGRAGGFPPKREKHLGRMSSSPLMTQFFTSAADESNPRHDQSATSAESRHHLQTLPFYYLLSLETACAASERRRAPLSLAPAVN